MNEKGLLIQNEKENNQMEKFRMVIDENVAKELSTKGHNLIAQIPSENHKERRVYVFANSELLEVDAQRYEEGCFL